MITYMKIDHEKPAAKRARKAPTRTGKSKSKIQKKEEELYELLEGYTRLQQLAYSVVTIKTSKKFRRTKKTSIPTQLDVLEFLKNNQK